jgi:hypothetical protein
MRTRLIRLWLLSLVGALAACSSHPTKIDCDGHLKPINAPAPQTQKPVQP